MEETKFRCEECGEAFDSKLDWEQHNRKVHSRYTCPRCLESFNAEDELDTHQLKTHPERLSN